MSLACSSKQEELAEKEIDIDYLQKRAKHATDKVEKAQAEALRSTVEKKKKRIQDLAEAFSKDRPTTSMIGNADIKSVVIDEE